MKNITCKGRMLIPPKFARILLNNINQENNDDESHQLVSNIFEEQFIQTISMRINLGNDLLNKEKDQRNDLSS